jgi:hypothetical protein
MTDPATPLDGTCARCGRSKRKVRQDSDGDLNKMRVREAADADPFCSSECCRIYYGLIKPTALRRINRKCKGCGCALDIETKGCARCRTRHAARERAEQKRREIRSNGALPFTSPTR